jgi:hypothetical protein
VGTPPVGHATSRLAVLTEIQSDFQSTDFLR